MAGQRAFLGSSVTDQGHSSTIERVVSQHSQGLFQEALLAEQLRCANNGWLVTKQMSSLYVGHRWMRNKD